MRGHPAGGPSIVFKTWQDMEEASQGMQLPFTIYPTRLDIPLLLSVIKHPFTLERHQVRDRVSLVSYSSSARGRKLNTSSGRVLTPFDLAEPEGTERGCSWPFVPFLEKKSCLSPPRILGLASQITTNDNLLRMPRHSNSVLVLVSTSIYCDANLHQTILYLCPFGRAVRPS